MYSIMPTLMLQMTNVEVRLDLPRYVDKTCTKYLGVL